MKWRFHVYKQKKVALECFDAGKITDIKLFCWTDNYPYVNGSVTLDGIRISTTLKLSATNGFGGVPTEFADLEKLLPNRLEVVHWDRPRTRGRSGEREESTTPKTISDKEVCDLLEAEKESYKIFVSDPRILLLSYCVVLDHFKGLYKILTAKAPTRTTAIKILESFNLLHPFTPEMAIDESFYDKLLLLADHIIAEHAPDLAKILLFVRDKHPVKRPKLIKVAGVFAVSDNATILNLLEESTPVTLKREPNNTFDANAIQLYAPIKGRDERIGYLPKEIAKELAPKLDAGSVISARVEEVHPKEKLILISLADPKDEDRIDELTVSWGGFPDERQTVHLSTKTRELHYRYQADYFEKNGTEFHLHFTQEAWEWHVLPMMKTCGFTHWKTAYRGSDIRYKKNLWKMSAKCGHKTIESYGCNATPIQFSHFLAFIQTCLNLNISKEFGRWQIQSTR